MQLRVDNTVLLLNTKVQDASQIDASTVSGIIADEGETTV